MIYIISTKYTQLFFSLVVDNLLKDAVYCINIYIPYNNEDEYFLYIHFFVRRYEFTNDRKLWVHTLPPWNAKPIKREDRNAFVRQRRLRNIDPATSSCLDKLG